MRRLGISGRLPTSKSIVNSPPWKNTALFNGSHPPHLQRKSSTPSRKRDEMLSLSGLASLLNREWCVKICCSRYGQGHLCHAKSFSLNCAAVEIGRASCRERV